MNTIFHFDKNEIVLKIIFRPIPSILHHIKENKPIFALPTFKSHKILKKLSKKVGANYLVPFLTSLHSFILTNSYKPKKTNRSNGHGNNRMPNAFLQEKYCGHFVTWKFRAVQCIFLFLVLTF